jgi:hypothetical protein
LSPSICRSQDAIRFQVSEFERGAHSGARAIGPYVVVELRECGEHAFHRLSSGRIVDRFGR